MACTKYYITLGIKRESVLMVDSKGVIYKRIKEGMNEYKEFFAAETDARTLEDTIERSDMFLGVSKANVVIDSGAAHIDHFDMEQYKKQLREIR